MTTSIGASGGGIKAKIRRALGALKHKDGSYSEVYVDGEGRLHVIDKASDTILGAIEGGKFKVSVADTLGVNVLNRPEAQTIKAKVFRTPCIEIPGIGTGSAYAAGDAFGGKFAIQVPKKGCIEAAIMYDLDDEGIETELWLFREDFSATTDNSAFAVSDADLMNLEYVIGIQNFANAGNNQIGINSGLGLPYEAPNGNLYCQCVTRGAPNIAAGNIPRVALAVLSYE